MHTVHMHTCLSCRLAAVCKGLASLQQRSSMHDLLAQDWFIWSQTRLFHFNAKFHRYVQGIVAATRTRNPYC